MCFGGCKRNILLMLSLYASLPWEQSCKLFHKTDMLGYCQLKQDVIQQALLGVVAFQKKPFARILLRN